MKSFVILFLLLSFNFSSAQIELIKSSGNIEVGTTQGDIDACFNTIFKSGFKASLKYSNNVDGRRLYSLKWTDVQFVGTPTQRVKKCNKDYYRIFQREINFYANSENSEYIYKTIDDVHYLINYWERDKLKKVGFIKRPEDGATTEIMLGSHLLSVKTYRNMTETTLWKIDDYDSFTLTPGQFASLFGMLEN